MMELTAINIPIRVEILNVGHYNCLAGVEIMWIILVGVEIMWVKDPKSSP